MAKPDQEKTVLETLYGELKLSNGSGKVVGFDLKTLKNRFRWRKK